MKIHYCTIADKPNDNLNILKAQYKAQGITLVVLGEDNKVTFGWGVGGANFVIKIQEFYNYILTLPEEDIVLFQDAFDVLFVGSEAGILKKFNSFGARAVFGAEIYPHPDRELANSYPTTDSKYRFVNSGTFMGNIGYLKGLLQKYPFAMDMDDQRYYSNIFLNEYSTGMIKLDYNQQIFACMAGDLDNLSLEDDRFITKKGSLPEIVHFNGCKGSLPSFYKWLTSERKPSDTNLGITQMNEDRFWKNNSSLFFIVLFFVLFLVTMGIMLYSDIII